MRKSIRLLAGAADFAARRHAGQTRKNGRTPYINHLAEVAHLVAETAMGGDPELVAAGFLHDVVEDGRATADEIELRFGRRIRRLVEELTDDMRLPKEERKRRQAEAIAAKSAGARLIKLADKVSNLREIATDPPPDWSAEERAAYAEWGLAVVNAGCRGLDARLEAELDRLAARLIGTDHADARC
jgi:(p)ppGpp synthase/HD superfamily hydrolase